MCGQSIKCGQREFEIVMIRHRMQWNGERDITNHNASIMIIMLPILLIYC